MVTKQHNNLFSCKIVLFNIKALYIKTCLGECLQYNVTTATFACKMKPKMKDKYNSLQP